MSKSSDKNIRPIEGGKPCPKCEKGMQRYEHSETWKPQPGRGYFIWWDKCRPCGHIQLYEEARRRPADE